MERDELMHRTRAMKCAADAGITDELSAFMSAFHPEVSLHTPTMFQARAESRERSRGGR